MDIINVQGRDVIECVHCKGTGICKNTEYKTTYREAYSDGTDRRYGAVLTCSKCGDGSFHYADHGFFGGVKSYPHIANLKGPVCAVCGGKGHNVL